VKLLNVAGPRASGEPGVGESVMRTLQAAFGQITLDGSRLLKELRSPVVAQRYGGQDFGELCRVAVLALERLDWDTGMMKFSGVGRED
jgi:hypothetical protein